MESYRREQLMRVVCMPRSTLWEQSIEELKMRDYILGGSCKVEVAGVLLLMYSQEGAR